MTVKCYYCDHKFHYVNMVYVIWIPAYIKFAPICHKCSNKRNVVSVASLYRSVYDMEKIKQKNLLVIP